MRDFSLCIFCLENTGDFVSEEHILPESLGNKSLILEPGIVCDRCNNERLGPLDEKLGDCPAVAVLRATQFIRTKKGRLPRVDRGNAGFFPLETEAGAHLYLRLPPDAPTPADGRFPITLEQPWSERDSSYAARAVLKAAFEMVAYDEGKRAALDERYDGVRRAVLHGFRGSLLQRRSGEPSTELSVTRELLDDLPTRQFGLGASVNVLGATLSTWWPGFPFQLRNVSNPNVLAAAQELAETRFSRTPSAKKSIVSIRADLTYEAVKRTDGPAEIRQGALDVERSLGRRGRTLPFDDSTPS